MSLEMETDAPETAERPNLDTVPTEILTHIGFHLAKLSPLRSPPYTLVPLLLTSRSMNGTLSLDNNPRLYAKIFGVKFDTAAIRRRERESLDVDFRGEDSATNAEDGSMQEDRPLKASNNDVINSRSWALELKRRFEALRMLKLAVVSRDVNKMKEQDVWTIYLMLLENDGKNLQHLLSQPTSTSAPTTPSPAHSSAFNPAPISPPVRFPASALPPTTTSNRSTPTTGLLVNYLNLYHEQDLVHKAMEPGLPSVDGMRVLMVWIYWLLTSKEMIQAEDYSHLEEFLFVLRPYVFAAGRYDIFFAPWTMAHLPTNPTSPETRPPSPASAADPYLANTNLSSNRKYIEHYGRRLAIRPPILSLAAIMNFFARIDRLLGVTRFEFANNVAVIGNEPIIPNDNRVVMFRPRVTSRYVTYTTVNDSKVHDQDYRRLVRCIDPKTSPGLSIEDWLGKFTGCWEGNFSFFDFDAYRNMLGGEARALYEGQFGEQSQVWRMKEIAVRRKAGVDVSMEDTPAYAINAGFHPNTSAFDLIVNQMNRNTGARRNSGTSITNAVVNLLENHPTDEHMVAILGGLEGYDMLSQSEIERIMKGEGTVMRRGKVSSCPGMIGIDVAWDGAFGVGRVLVEREGKVVGWDD